MLWQSTDSHAAVIAFCRIYQNTGYRQPDMFYKNIFNDPSAGSPTETLLRLLLPLNNQVRSASVQHTKYHEGITVYTSRDLTKQFISSSDGRCVQRAGT